MRKSNTPRQRIAVIGSGIGGLTAAWLLKQRHEITLFEQHERPGMGIFAVDYTSNGQTTRIDIPTRIFCAGYYPHLFALLKAIGVRLHATNHSAAFANEQGDIYLHYGVREVLGRSWNFPKLDHLPSATTLRLLRDSVRFFRQVERDAARAESLRGMTLAQYLEHAHYSQEFLDGVLLPTLSVICTCDMASVLRYPADLLLGYLGSGVMQQGVVRAEQGVDAIVPRMLEGITVLCGTAVSRIEERSDGHDLHTADGRTHRFDRVIVASQAQQAADMLDTDSPFPALLRQVPFEKSMMRVHTDASVLPRSRWPMSPVTYHVAAGAPRPEVTVDLTRAFSTYHGQQPVFQTWHPLRPAGAGHTLAEAHFTRPLVTLESRKAVSQLRQLQREGDHRLMFCGAYMADKVPLLEAAVDSAMEVTAQLGVQPPWGTAA